MLQNGMIVGAGKKIPDFSRQSVVNFIVLLAKSRETLRHPS